MGMIRGIVSAVTEGVIKLFSAAGRSDETFQDREYMQHYGYTSRPLPGAELVIVNEGNHYLAIASDDRRYRIAIENGEVCIYTDEGDHIRFKRGMEIYIESGNKLNAVIENEVDITTQVALVNASTSCTVISPVVQVTAETSCQVTSPVINLGGDRDSLRELIDERLMAIFNNHVHSGVDAGSGTSGPPTSTLTEANVCTTITKAR